MAETPHERRPGEALEGQDTLLVTASAAAMEAQEGSWATEAEAEGDASGSASAHGPQDLEQGRRAARGSGEHQAEEHQSGERQAGAGEHQTGEHQGGVGFRKKRVHTGGEPPGTSSGEEAEARLRGSPSAERSKRPCPDGDSQPSWGQEQGERGVDATGSLGAGPSAFVGASDQGSGLLAGPPRPQRGDATVTQACAFEQNTLDMEEEAKRRGLAPALPLFLSFCPLRPDTGPSPAAAGTEEDKEPSPVSGEAHDRVSSLQQRVSVASGAPSATEHRRAHAWPEAPLLRVGRLQSAAGPGAGPVGPGSQATAGAGTLGPRSPRLVMEPSVGRLGAPRSAHTFFSTRGRLSSQPVRSFMSMAPRHPWDAQRRRPFM